jgi:NAD(P)H-hydrate epimerase
VKTLKISLYASTHESFRSRYDGKMNNMERSLLKQLFTRQSHSHKYDYGRVLVIGGSSSMAGAPVLTGRAALRSGAGVVELCVPECIANVAASFDPCLITHHFSSDAYGCFAPDCVDDLYLLAVRADVIVCGPGLGRSPGLVAIVQKLWSELPQPVIFDADALFALSHLSDSAISTHAGLRIITPHAGEMLHLLAEPIEITDHNSSDYRLKLEQAAQEFAERINAIIVLKGCQTLTTNGIQHIHNTSGNPGMATAGAGDVLSGIIAALIGQGLPSFEAAHLAVWAHGISGDLAAQALTELSMTASDIIDYLPATWLKIQSALDAE